MCSAFALITGGLQAATPVLLPNVIYLALWPHSAVLAAGGDEAASVSVQGATGSREQQRQQPNSG